MGMSGTIAAIVGRRLAAPGSLIVMLLVLVGSAPDAAGAVAPAAPAWSLEAIDGRTVSFHDQLARGPVVVSFWATWCKPCVEELPYFEQLQSEIAGKKVKIILVSLDFKKDIPTKLLQFVRDNHIQSDVIALADGRYNDWIEKVDPEWGGAIPITLVYGPKGRVFQPEQFASYEELKTMVLGLL